MVVEVDDRVILVHQPDRAVSVLRLRNPVTYRVASHVGLLIEIRKITERHSRALAVTVTSAVRFYARVPVSRSRRLRRLPSAAPAASLR